MIRGAVAAGVVLALAGGSAVPAAAAPVFNQMVVFRDGDAKSQFVRSTKTRVNAGGRRCRVPGATPLAALVRSDLPKLSMKDFSHACDPSSLFVEAIGNDRNRGESGWVYKVGNRQGTTSAADPSGPFGSGRIKKRTRVLWFYCVFRSGGCQRNLGVKVVSNTGHLRVRVMAYDDEGRGRPAVRAFVTTLGGSGNTDERGYLTLDLIPGRYTMHAEKKGTIRSHDETVTIK